jgi:hypothetical protein
MVFIFLIGGLAGHLGTWRGPEHKPRGMYEFAFSDPDGAFVRIGWSSRLMS